MGGKIKHFLITMIALSIVAIVIANVHAEWTEERIKFITESIQQSYGDWTIQDTRNMMEEAKHAGDLLKPIFTDKGITRIEVKGDTVLLNGKDITGNLGSKTTYGPNSPIVENVKDSQMTTGNNSLIVKDNTFHFTINLSLSIALSFSLVLNGIQLYLFRRKRREQ